MYNSLKYVKYVYICVCVINVKNENELFGLFEKHL